MLAKEMERLAAIMARLRARGRLPLGPGADPPTLKPYVIEEAYEVVADRRATARELRRNLATYCCRWSSSARSPRRPVSSDRPTRAGHREKLVRRHPHVFGEPAVEGPKRVVTNWERIKRPMKPAHEWSGGHPRMPPRSPPWRVQKWKAPRSASTGRNGAMAKVEEELAEFQEVFADGDAGNVAGSTDRLQDELGDLFLPWSTWRATSRLTRRNAPRQTTYKFIRRFSHIEDVAAGHGRQLTEMTLAEMDEILGGSEEGRGAEGDAQCPMTNDQRLSTISERWPPHCRRRKYRSTSPFSYGDRIRPLPLGGLAHSG